MRRLLLILCFFLFATSSGLSIQETDLKKIAKEMSYPVPVVFGKRNDGLPEKLDVVGRITKVSFLQRPCGVLYGSGTIKLELLQQTPNYPHPNVFVVVNCLEDSRDEKKYINKVVRLKLAKLYPELHDAREASWYFEFINNTIDSGKIPFYYTTAGPQEILSQ